MNEANKKSGPEARFLRFSENSSRCRYIHGQRASQSEQMQRHRYQASPRIPQDVWSRNRPLNPIWEPFKPVARARPIADPKA